MRAVSFRNFVNADTAQRGEMPQNRKNERNKGKREKEGVKHTKEGKNERKKGSSTLLLSCGTIKGGIETEKAPVFFSLSSALFSRLFCNLREMRSPALCSGSAAATMPQASSSARTAAGVGAAATTTTPTPLPLAARPRRRCPSRRFSSSSFPDYYSASRLQASWIVSASSEAARAQEVAPNSGEEASSPSTLSSDQSSPLLSPSAAAATVRARRPLNTARVATLGASKSAARAVDEGARPLGA